MGFVVGGDFNLLPDADSLTVFERRFEMRDLIKEYGISNTRSITQYKKECRFADYVFVNKNREVRTFSVDETADDVSDHLPLIVTVSI